MIDLSNDKCGIAFSGLFILVILAMCSAAVFAKSDRQSKYVYLMYSNPMYLKLTDGSQLKLQVTAYAKRRKDRLSLSVNDQIVDEGYVRSRDRRLTLRYKDEDLNIRVVCKSLRSEDATFNHSCNVYSKQSNLGTLDVVNRIYPTSEPPQD